MAMPRYPDAAMSVRLMVGTCHKSHDLYGAHLLRAILRFHQPRLRGKIRYDAKGGEHECQAKMGREGEFSHYR
jgi:hypothetical protein